MTPKDDSILSEYYFSLMWFESIFGLCVARSLHFCPSCEAKKELLEVSFAQTLSRSLSLSLSRTFALSPPLSRSISPTPSQNRTEYFFYLGLLYHFSHILPSSFSSLSLFLSFSLLPLFALHTHSNPSNKLHTQVVVKKSGKKPTWRKLLFSGGMSVSVLTHPCRDVQRKNHREGKFW